MGGPKREMYSGVNPPSYVTFNSIKDNEKIGDERNFVRGREVGTGSYRKELIIRPGRTYEISIYIHNNARSSVNWSDWGVAKNVRLVAQVPSRLKPTELGKISGIISADNAVPDTVWDEVFISSTEVIKFSYVPSSAIITSNGPVNGKVAPDSLFSKGISFGYFDLNGELPGCVQYSGFVTFRLLASAVEGT